MRVSTNVEILYCAQLWGCRGALLVQQLQTMALWVMICLHGLLHSLYKKNNLPLMFGICRASAVGLEEPGGAVLSRSEF